MPEPRHAEVTTTARWVLTAVEFDVLWERLRLGPTPVVLRLAAPGRNRAERTEIVKSGLHALRSRGLADHGGPDPELVRLLTLLDRASPQLELRAWLDRSARAVATGRPGSAVVAVRQDETIIRPAARCPRPCSGRSRSHRRDPAAPSPC